MIRNYFKIALRNLTRQFTYSLINILGFTAGITSVLLIMMYVVDETSYDKFHQHSDRLYRVVENQYYDGQPVFPVAVTPGPLAPALKDEYPEIIKSTRLNFNTDIFRYKENSFTEEGAFVDRDFMDMFSFPIVKGNADAMFDNINAMIISERLAKKYFADEDPIGKTINLNGNSEVEITAVMADLPTNSHIQLDYLLNTDRLRSFWAGMDTNWGSNTLYTYVQLSEQASVAEVDEKIKGQIKKNNESSVTDIYLQPMTDVHLSEVDFTADISGKGSMQYVKIFSIVAVFILLIACINFMNLATARSTRRAKEVGLRKAIGAHRSQLIFQFLGESMLVTAISIILSVLLVDILLPYFNTLSGKTLSLGIFSDWNAGLEFGLGLLAITLFIGILAGSYPAFYLSSFQPSGIIKGKVGSASKGKLFRRILVVIQFSVSIILIVGTFVVDSQLDFINRKNLGYAKDNIVYMPQVSNERETFKKEIERLPGTLSVSFTNQHPGYVESSTSGISWEGQNEEETMLIHYQAVDFDYLSTMQIELLDGRTFSKDNPADSVAVLINEEAARIMGFDEPIGQRLSTGVELNVIGVVKNFHFKSIHQKIEPLMLYYFPQRFSRTLIKVADGDPTETLAGIESVWQQFNPEEPFNYRFLDEDFDNMYRAEQTTAKLFNGFAMLAIIVSCLGLFGLASFTVEQRTKELGIRKVLGASVPRLFYSISADFTVLVVVALFIAVPGGWYLMDQWLESFAYSADISVWIFIAAAFIAVIIALLAVSYQSLKAAKTNPVDALRSE
ncbi:MAG: ABC transporter permease [Bacteroidota bacterium]